LLKLSSDVNECKPLSGRRVSPWKVGMKKHVEIGKTYLELSAAQGFEPAVALLKELRECE
jgi:hypothetical protein